MFLKKPVLLGGFGQVFGLICLANSIMHLETYAKDVPKDWDTDFHC